METDDPALSDKESDLPARKLKGKEAATGGDSEDDESCSQDSNETSSSSASSEDGFEGQDELLLRGLKTVVPLPSGDAIRVARNTDNYMVTQYMSLCYAIDKWTKDAFRIANIGDDDVGNRLGKLVSAIEDTYRETFGGESCKSMYLALIQRHQQNGTLPISYIAHWIMFNVWEDIFELYFPRGLGDKLQDALETLDESVAQSTDEGKRTSARYRQWFSETMFALTVNPQKRMVKSRKEDVEYICTWQLEHLRDFFGFNDAGRQKLEQQYREDIVARAMALHRFKTCSIFHYGITYQPVPRKAVPEDHGVRRYQHVDTLAVVAPVLVDCVYHLPLYPALVRLRQQDEVRDAGAPATVVLEPPTFIAHQKAPSP